MNDAQHSKDRNATSSFWLLLFKTKCARAIILSPSPLLSRNHNIYFVDYIYIYVSIGRMMRVAMVNVVASTAYIHRHMLKLMLTVKHFVVRSKIK